MTPPPTPDAPTLVVACADDRTRTADAIDAILHPIERAVAGLAGPSPTTVRIPTRRPRWIAQWALAHGRGSMVLRETETADVAGALLLRVEGGVDGDDRSVVLGRARRNHPDLAAASGRVVAETDPDVAAVLVATAARHCVDALRSMTADATGPALAMLEDALDAASMDAVDAVDGTPRTRRAFLATPWSRARAIATLEPHGVAIDALARFDRTTMGAWASCDDAGRVATLQPVGIRREGRLDAVRRLRLQAVLEALPVVDHGNEGGRR